MDFNRERAKAAVQFLVDTPYYSHYTKRMRALLDRPRSLPYREDAECLNELLLIGRQNRQALENLLALAAFKRDDRSTYQRNYMAAKRARDRKVLQLEALLRGRELDLDQRNETLLKQYDIWNKEHEAFLDARAAEHRTEFGDDPRWQDRNAYTRAFWEMKDAELDALLQEATKALAKGSVKRKRLVVVEPPNPTVMRSKLLDALDKRRR